MVATGTILTHRVAFAAGASSSMTWGCAVPWPGICAGHVCARSSQWASAAAPAERPSWLHVVVAQRLQLRETAVVRRLGQPEPSGDGGGAPQTPIRGPHRGRHRAWADVRVVQVGCRAGDGAVIDSPDPVTSSDSSSRRGSGCLDSHASTSERSSSARRSRAVCARVRAWTRWSGWS